MLKLRTRLYISNNKQNAKKYDTTGCVGLLIFLKFVDRKIAPSTSVPLYYQQSNYTHSYTCYGRLIVLFL